MKTFLDAIDAVAMVVLALGFCLLAWCALSGMLTAIFDTIEHPSPLSTTIILAFLAGAAWMWGRKEGGG